MTGQIIDITEDGYFLHTERDWLVITKSAKNIGKVFLGDIECILVHAKYATYSHSFILKAAERNIPVVICNEKHQPTSTLLPLFGHHSHAGRIQAQALASKPTKKRLWRQIVRKKIEEQARTLGKFNIEKGKALLKLKSLVIEGDVSNVEARAARYYWANLFTKDFRREREQAGLNAHLNYGYTILRSALARSVVAGGLVPALGVGHHNARNNFCLVDDLIEPFRPLVDTIVKQNEFQWNTELTSDAKSALAGLLEIKLNLENEKTDLLRIFGVTVNSLVNVYANKTGKLIFPKKIMAT